MTTSEKADLILYNATVLTIDPKIPKANLVAIKGNRIIYVGDDDKLSDLGGQKTQKINCHGRTLIPGFNDAHCHILAFASSLLSVDCSPSAVSSITDIKAQIHKQAQKLTRGTWIRATGYNEFYLAEKRHPNRNDLDEAAPHHPVKLMHRSSHACVLNSIALSLIGISNETPEPPGGMIERDLDSGNPNGLLFEMNSYLDTMIPSLSQEELEKGIRIVNKKCLSHGITSLQDATAHNRLVELNSLRGFSKRGILVPRLSVMIGFASWGELQDYGSSPHCGDDAVRLGALKIALSEARGSLYPSLEEIKEMALTAHRDGYQLAIHAVDENTVATAARVLEHVLYRLPRRDHRHRIEHCSVCPPHLLKRLRSVRAVVVTQPSFIYYNGERYLKTVPEDHQRWLYSIGSFFHYDLIPAAGSDSPIAPMNPLLGIYAAVTRKTEQGEELVPQEHISPLAALKMHTQAAAYASFDEAVKGSITVGKMADLALLSADPTQVSPDDIRRIGVEMTIVDGKIIWQT